MTDFNSLDSARETLAAFDRKIAQAEDETRRLVERLHAAGIGYKSKHVKDAWDQCAEQTRPLRTAAVYRLQRISRCFTKTICRQSNGLLK